LQFVMCVESRFGFWTAKAQTLQIMMGVESREDFGFCLLKQSKIQIPKPKMPLLSCQIFRKLHRFPPAE
jgi:hypothetical protein